MQRNSTLFIPVPIHQLLIATIALMAGIVCATREHWIWGGLTLGAAIVSIALSANKKAVPFACISFALGIASGSNSFRRTHEVPLSAAPFTLVGTIEAINERYTFAQQQELVLTLTDRAVQLLLDSPAPVLLGDTIVATNVRSSHHAMSKPVPVVHRKPYLQKLFGKRSNVALLERPRWHLGREIAALHSDTLARIQKQLDAHAFKFFCLMFLGNYPNQGPMIEIENYSFGEKLQSADFCARQWFNNWGIAHYLARSGLHLVIVVILLQFLLGLIPLHYLGKRILLGGYLLIYALLSWPAISFTRALLMVALGYGADFVSRPYQALHLVTVATYVVLLAQPTNLFYADFQLSFGLTFALAWANHVHKQRKLLHKWQTIALE